MSLYEVEFPQDARRELENNVRITTTKEKAIKITAEAKSPQLAADLANFYAENLDRLNRTITNSKAGQKRQYIERRVEETHVQLVKTEEALKDFQEKNKTVAVEAQAQAMIEAAAMIQAQIMASEVQLQAMSSYLSPDNPQLVPVKSSLDELRKQLSAMQVGKGSKTKPSDDSLHPAMIKVPTLALEYGRLLRDLKVQETLYTLLVAQYEQAKLQEARDTPTVQVLDPAVPADRKSRPSIMLNVLVVGLMSLVGALFLVFSIETNEQIRARELQAVQRNRAEAA
jgi:capsule polysaccharide export protein KpsE/RkpR